MALDKSDKKISAADQEADVKTALIVDDSYAQRVLIARLLARLGYRVHEAESGTEALEVCYAHQPDLVLSDWMMPGMDGLKFCWEFRKLKREKYGYFILLTSRGRREDITRGFDAGADDFLTKPVNSDELRSRIRAGERILKMEQELTEKNRIIIATLDELQTIHDAINMDLIEARELQTSLLRETYQDTGGAEVSLVLQSSGHVGGDLVGMFNVDEYRFGVYGIDVCGHGISSALMTARLAGFFSSGVPDQNVALRKVRKGVYRARCPAETVATLNDLILHEVETELYFTLLLAIVDQSTGQVIFTQAGNPSPVVQRASGEVENHGHGGFPVGLVADAAFEACHVQLQPGDRFLIHSDGITECACEVAGLFGDEGLGQFLRQNADLKGPAFLDGLITHLNALCPSRTFKDDVSGVLVELKSDPCTG